MGCEDDRTKQSQDCRYRFNHFRRTFTIVTSNSRFMPASSGQENGFCSDSRLKIGNYRGGSDQPAHSTVRPSRTHQRAP
jgi:hypothetical protein